MPKKLTDAQRAFLATLEELCEAELNPHRGSMSEVEHELALKQRMKALAVKFYDGALRDFGPQVYGSNP
ncbi:MAG: hypothetical protein ABFE07_28895 [Armatimonadia bacterium]